MENAAPFSTLRKASIPSRAHSGAALAARAQPTARQGARVKYLGHLGQDAFGDAILQRLRAAGVDTGAVRREALPTGTAFVAYARDGSRQFVFNVQASASGCLGAASVPPDALHGCRCLHVMGSSLNSPGALAALDVLLDQAQMRGTRISFDPNIRPELLTFAPMAAALKRVFARCHLFLPSETDLPFFFPDVPLETALARCLERPGLDAMVLKQGARGCRYLDRQQRFHAAPLAVTERDPTGASDCFGGTFLAALCQGLSPERACSEPTPPAPWRRPGSAPWKATAITSCCNASSRRPAFMLSATHTPTVAAPVGAEPALLEDLVQRNRAGTRQGLYAICSAHPPVLCARPWPTRPPC